jgi:hypothetical protein
MPKTYQVSLSFTIEANSYDQASLYAAMAMREIDDILVVEETSREVICLCGLCKEEQQDV